MSKISYAAVAAEILSIIVCAVILYGNIFEAKKRTKRGDIFSLIVVTEIVAVAFDLISWITEGVSNVLHLQSISANVATVLTLVLICEYGMYLFYLIRERKDISPVPFRCFYGFCSAAIIFTGVSAFLDKLVYVESNVQEYGSFYDWYVAANMILLGFCIVMVVINRKTFGIHDMIAVILYVAMPVISAIISFINEDWAFAYPATMVSLLIIYVMIQSERTSKLEEEGKLSHYYATHDELTGLLSRRAYIEELKLISEKDTKIGVIFGDLNGLKFENDHFGHEAGDRKIIRMAEDLRRYFRNENIYRISGDEFVVLLPEIEKDSFEVKIKELRKVVGNGGSALASLGTEYGSCRKVNELVQMAETNMYKDKEDFYNAHPDMKR